MLCKVLSTAFLFLMLVLPAQAGQATKMSATDFNGEQWAIRISGGFLTFLSSHGECSQPVAVKPEFEELVRFRQTEGNSLPMPDGMAVEYLSLLDDSLTGGMVCSSIGVNRTEILLLLKLPDGKTRLRIAEWNNKLNLYACLDNDTVPGTSWFDTIHFADSEISLHWIADKPKQDATFDAFSAGEHNAIITRDYHGTWWIRSISVFGQKDLSYTLGWNYIVNNDLRKIGSNDDFMFGDYVWNSIEHIDFGGLYLEDDVLMSAFEQTYSQWAVVRNPDPDDRLHLRTGPDRSLESLGKFYSRTPVFVLESKGAWSHVLIGSDNLLEGWMMNRYLAFGEEMNKVTCAFPSRKGLYFRDEDVAHPVYTSPSLDAISTWEAKGGLDELIIGIYEDQWFIVMNAEGQTGYVPVKWYWEGNG